MPCLYTNNDGIHLIIAVFFDVRSRNRTIVFVTHYTHVMHVQYRGWYRSIFSDTDTGGICLYRVPDASIGLTLFHSSIIEEKTLISGSLNH